MFIPKSHPSRLQGVTAKLVRLKMRGCGSMLLISAAVA
jgi:hypothetical protein